MEHRTTLSMGKVFAAAAMIEGITWSGLLIGMFLKYGIETTDVLVWLFGRLHGIAFLFYLVISLMAAHKLRWPWWGTTIALLAAIPPLVTIPVEIWFKRRGLLDTPTPQ